MHEASLRECNSFLTLTFQTDPVSLDVGHLQLFFKRLRNRDLPVRYYACGEYGERLGRPHYHVLLFGTDFSLDRYPWRTTPSGFPVYRSPTLEECWPHGNSEIGDITFESASYVAGYVRKKIKGDHSDDHYVRYDEEGVGHEVKPEFAVMSRRPGIGAGWLDRFRPEVLRDDSVLSRGRLCKPPRYYDNLNAELEPELVEAHKRERKIRALERSADSTDERLSVREAVARARLSIKGKRSYET